MIDRQTVWVLRTKHEDGEQSFRLFSGRDAGLPAFIDLLEYAGGEADSLHDEIEGTGDIEADLPDGPSIAFYAQKTEA